LPETTSPDSTNSPLLPLVQSLPKPGQLPKQTWGQWQSLTKLNRLVGLDSILGARRLSEANAKSTMKALHGDSHDGDNYVPPVDDDMIVNDSPTTNYHITQPPPPSKVASTLMPLALGALLATTGIGGIGAALLAPTILDALKPKPPANHPPVIVVPGNPNTQPPPVKPPAGNAGGQDHTYQGRANIRVGDAVVTPPPGR